MRRIIAIIAVAAAVLTAGASAAYADPTAPTNGGSANGGGSSGQCTGDQASRPAACHNGHGADGN